MRSIVFCILFSITLSIGGIVSGQNARQHYKAGIEYMQNKYYNDAIDQFSKAIALDPKYSEAYEARGNAYENRKEFEKAANDYIRSAVFNNNSSENYQNAARLFFKLGNYKLAQENINKSLLIKPKYSEAYRLNAEIFFSQDDYQQAYNEIDKALSLNENAYNYYLHGVIAEKLEMNNVAEKDYIKSISKDKYFDRAYLSLAKIQLKTGNPDDAFKTISEIIKYNNSNSEAYAIRSDVYSQKLEFSKALEDISKSIALDPDIPHYYFIRGNYYKEYSQYQYAINDYSKAIAIDNSYIDAYLKRAETYEELENTEEAVKDYVRLTTLEEKLKEKNMTVYVNEKIYMLNKENENPEIFILIPKPINNFTLPITENYNSITIKGIIKDKSEIVDLIINDVNVPVISSIEGYYFSANVNLDNTELITISAKDIYNNVQKNSYPIERIEINSPVVEILSPYASDNGELFLDSDDSYLYLEGKVTDQSLIKSIIIDDVSASYALNSYNPRFTATIDISRKNKLIVTAEDIHGNITSKQFVFNKNGILLTENNPMGKTWVVFIENSMYKELTNLDGPSKDIELIKESLSRYKINKIIYKQNMTKKEMERFFSIDLRDLIKSNKVNSLLIWYAGHGKYIRETGYWLPIDANSKDEFSYYNVNALKASLYSYGNLKHTLVITDACESGPSFNIAMRDNFANKTCDDLYFNNDKSSQILSSSGYEKALDNSLFTKAFANSLENNENSCIPIELIAERVTAIVQKNTAQKPKFGKIAGLEDKDGSFFFVVNE